MSKIKKPLAFLLSLLMLMTALPLAAIPASAASAAQLDGVLRHLPNERNAHYYKDSTEAAILAAREAAETALETGEGISAAYNLCLGAFDEAWACDEIAYNEDGDTVFVFVNRDESKAHATLYLDTDASASLKPGDTFDVTFSIKADFPLRQFRVAFAYDKAVFEADGSSITYADGITDLLDVNSFPLYTEYGYFNGTLNKSRQYYPAEWDQETVSKYNFIVKEFGRNTEKDADYMLPTEKTEIFTVSMKVKDDAGLVGKTGEIFLCDEMLSTMENDYLFDGIPALPIKIYRGFSTNPYEEVADDDINIRQACKVTDEAAGVGQTITWDGTALKTYSIVGEGEDEPDVDLSKLSTGAKVQFGTQSGSPVEWVIGGDGTTGMSAPEGCIALVSSGLVASDTKFDVTGYSNIYATSNLRSVVENAVSFTDDEKVIIQSRTLGSPDIAGDPVTAMVWAPTLADAESLSGAGLSGTGSSYLLCSPGDAEFLAANVYPDGGVEPYGVDTSSPEGVRAGLYIDLSKITSLTLVEGTTDTYIVNAPEEDTHTHTFSEKWSTDETAHWHVCTADDCDIEDYSTCGIDEVAYGEHIGMDDDYTCDTCGYVNTEGQLAAAKEEAADAINELVKSTDSDTVKALAAEAKKKIADAATAEEINSIVEEYTDKINYRKLYDGTSAELDASLNSDGYSDEMKAIFADTRAKMENIETYEELREFLEEFREKIELQQAREQLIAELEDIIECGIYSDKIVEMASNYIDEFKKIDNMDDFEKLLGECDVKLSHQFFKDAACNEVLKLAGKNPSEKVMKIINDAIDEIQGMEETPDFDDIYMDVFNRIIYQAEEDVAQCKAEEKALAKAIADAKKDLEEAKKDYVSYEAKLLLDRAITSLDEAESLDEIDRKVESVKMAAAEADGELAEAIATAKENLVTARGNAKSDEAKTIFDNAIAALDNATSLENVETIVEGAEMNAANADKALAEAIATAKSDLETAKINAKSDAAKAALDEAIANVEKAANLDDVASAKSTGTAAAAATDKALDDAKAEAKDALETAKAEATSKEAKAAIDKAIANVEKATNPADVASAKSAGTTAAANADKTLADTISNFKKNLETAKNDAKSDAAKAVYTNAIAALDNAKSLEDVETIVEGAEMAAANADKALADAKTDAIETLESAKVNAKSDAAKAAIGEAIEKISKATNPEAVAEEKADAEAAAAEADKALADAKAEAKETLETAKKNAKSDEAKAFFDEAIAALDFAASPEEVKSIVEAVSADAAAADKALDDAKAEAIETLEAAKEKAVSDEAKAALDEALADVEKATNPTATAAAKNSGLENAADADEALAEAKADAKKALEEVLDNAIADDAKAALEEAIEDIDNVTNLKAVADKKATAEAAAEAVEKELADAKAEAIKAVEGLAGENATDEVKQIVENAKETINSATNLDAVDTAKADCFAAVEYMQHKEGFTVPELAIQLGYRETVSVNAESTTNKIIYTSSNEKVVTVDEDGNLKAVGKGKATVTATIEGTDISEEIEIEVNYTFWDSLVWHIRNLLELIASGFKWLLALIGINL